MSDEQASPPGMEPDAVAKGLESGEVQVIDVRDDREWEAGRVPGSRHVLLAELPGSSESIDRETRVVFVCRGGSRSAMAAEAFRASGYDAYNLSGGLVAWAESGLPLEPEGGEVVERSLT
jgi:rhodanese-related sulfurtransferase